MRKLPLIIGGSVLATALAVPLVLRAARKPSPPPAAAKAPAPAPLRVSTVTVAPSALAERIAATGTIRAEEAVELVAETSGKIAAIAFREGTRVRKGDLLVKLSDADLRAGLESARQRLGFAELRERRSARLLESGVANQEDHDAARNELLLQRAAVSLAEALLAKAEIRAPFDGIVGLRFVSEGAFVTAASRIATLQKIDNLKVDFSVPEKYAGRIPVGGRVLFTVAGDSRSFAAEVYAVEPRIDLATRSVLIRALSASPGAGLVPGAFASVEVTLSEVGDAILVPSISVLPGVQETAVFVVVDGKAQRRAVVTGTRTESSVHILSGLRPGDVVITSGLQQLRAGAPVAPGKQPSDA